VSRPPQILLPLLAVLLLLAGCGKFLDFTDSATRLADQIRDEAAALRQSGATTRTFAHRPAAEPDGLPGDYRIEFVSSAPPGDGRRALGTAKSLDGPLHSMTTYHLNFVQVPQNLSVRHHQGEPTLVTLELRDGQVCVTELK
jgi:hypothetical protein